MMMTTMHPSVWRRRKKIFPVIIVDTRDTKIHFISGEVQGQVSVRVTQTAKPVEERQC